MAFYGIVWYIMLFIGVIQHHIGIMEKKIETTR